MECLNEEIAARLRPIEELCAEGRLDRAFSELLKLAQNYPDHAEVHNDLGVLYCQFGEIDKAVLHLKRAVQLSPDFTDAVENLAELSASIKRRTNLPTVDIPLEDVLAPLRERSSTSTGDRHGACSICGSDVEFILDNPENVRESLVCPFCRSISRDRLLIYTLGLLMGEDRPLNSWRANPNVKIFETTGHRGHPRFLEKKFDYFNTEFDPAMMHGEFDNRRYADLQRIPYHDCFFEAILTSDVFEHVRLYRQALGEAHRVLKPGGVMLLQIPYVHQMEKTHVLVEPRGDEDIFHEEPQYHAQDTLVYRIYGRQFLDELTAAGFEVEFATTELPEQAISPQDIIVARKRAMRYEE